MREYQKSVFSMELNQCVNVNLKCDQQEHKISGLARGNALNEIDNEIIQTAINVDRWKPWSRWGSYSYLWSCDLELYSYTRGNQVRSFKAAAAATDVCDDVKATGQHEETIK